MLFQLIFSTALLGLSLAGNQCPLNSLSLEPNENLCYSFHSKFSTFASASTHCKSFGAQLVSLKTNYINTFIASLAGIVFDDLVFFWSGGNRLQKSPTENFEWSDGEKFEYEHFGSGQKESNGSCVSVDVTEGRWKTENCFAELAFICEFTAGKGIVPIEADELEINDNGKEGDATTFSPFPSQEPSREPSTPPPSGPVYYTNLPAASEAPAAPSASPIDEATPEPRTLPPSVYETPQPEPTHDAPDVPSLPPASVGPLYYTFAPAPDAPVAPSVSPSSIYEPPHTTDVTDDTWSAPPKTPTCPAGWELFEGSCYIVQRPMSWSEAEASCHIEGSDLASIHSKEENTFVTEYAIKKYKENKYEHNEGIWIGLKRINGTLVWSDETEKNYSNFAGMEPNNFDGKEQCIDIYLSGSSSYSWNDYSCDAKFISVCKKQAFDAGDLQVSTTSPEMTLEPSESTEATLAPLLELTCPSGWELYGDSCYKIHPKKSWNDAQAECQSQGSHLASIHSKAENDFISELGHDENTTCDWFDQVWIGFTNITDSSYAWIDGSAKTFTNWLPYEPDNKREAEQCAQTIVAINCEHRPKGMWNDFNCENKVKFVCKKQANGVFSVPTFEPIPEINTEVPTTPEPSCPWLWHMFEGFCYTINPKMSWNDAQAECVRQDSHLASIHSKEENDFISELGNRENNSCNWLDQVWIGFNNITEASYAWIDGSAKDFDNWIPREPDNLHKKESCAEITVAKDCKKHDFGQWNDYKCSNEVRSVCKKKAGSPGLRPFNIITRRTVTPSTSEKPTTTAPPSCPTGWEIFNGFCYKVYPKESWSDAEIVCQKDEAHLVSIHGEEENSFVTELGNKNVKGDLLSESNCEGLWTGSTKDSGGLTWSDKTAFGWANFNMTQPDNQHGNESCIEVYLGATQCKGQFNLPGKWNDLACSTKLPFVCKKKADGATAPDHDDIPAVITSAPEMPTTDVTSPIPVLKCQADWETFNGMCYKLYPKKSWSDAEIGCQKEGAHLISIHDEEENSFVTDFAKKQIPTPQLQDNDPRIYDEQLWSGLKKIGESTFAWSDQTPTNYTNYHSYEPDNNGGNEACVEIYIFGTISIGKWNDYNCQKELNYICKKQPTPIPRIGVIFG